VERFNAKADRLSSSAPVKGEVLQVIRNSNAFYALVAPVPRGQDPSCSTTEPCFIERLQTPKLKSEKWLPRSPFAEE
jgi:hypothetical protein